MKQYGEAWKICSDCGSKLHSIDVKIGEEDNDKIVECPNKEKGRCNYPPENYEPTLTEMDL